MRVIGFESFVKVLSTRLKRKYDVKTLSKVLDCYLSSKVGLISKFEEGIEFKDQYFGTFRYSEKGYYMFCDKIKELMRLERFILTCNMTLPVTRKNKRNPMLLSGRCKTSLTGIST
jgi:hypothetical protein